MRLGQIKWNNQIAAAIFEDGTVARPVPDYSLYDLIRIGEMERVPVEAVAQRLVSAHREEAAPLIPIHPREVWACGCTYRTSAEFRDAEQGTREGFYAHVYREARPEIFFKGTSRHCVGPGQAIGIRSDSVFTAPEPELAIVLGMNSRIIGYTLANDVSAWDIERENPLYLPQSKVYTACCAIGPVIVTADEIPNPYKLELTCTIRRGAETIFEGRVSTSELNRKFETLLEYLLRANPVPAGSVLLTGTGIIVTEKHALQPGDIVSISVPEIGELQNAVAVVG
ncbi:MAG TPA: fumarylacetoacetate hydrolase family protein [Bryobacteraceae bacterium]|nr:fumarylacetoacetate hydrolase family protein [Bryobacteraceae bacterium]